MAIERPDLFSECANCQIARGAILTALGEGARDVSIHCVKKSEGFFKKRDRIDMTARGSYIHEGPSTIVTQLENLLDEKGISAKITQYYYEPAVEVTSSCPGLKSNE